MGMASGWEGQMLRGPVGGPQGPLTRSQLGHARFEPSGRDAAGCGHKRHATTNYRVGVI
jgi:hypothetical protein